MTVGPLKPRASTGFASTWGGSGSIFAKGKPKPVSPSVWGGAGSIFGTGVAPKLPALPPAPAAPPAATGAAPETNLPIDPNLQNLLSIYAKQRDQSQAGLAGNRAATLLGYGYTEQPGTGQLAFDPNNPYSRAALLKRSYDQSQARATTQMGAAGQRFSGAYEDTQNNIGFQRGAASDALLKALTAALLGNTQGQQQATTGYEVNAENAKLAAAGRAVTNNGGGTSQADATAPTPTVPSAPVSPPLAAKPGSAYPTQSGFVNVPRPKPKSKPKVTLPFGFGRAG